MDSNDMVRMPGTDEYVATRQAVNMFGVPGTIRFQEEVKIEQEAMNQTWKGRDACQKDCANNLLTTFSLN